MTSKKTNKKLDLKDLAGSPKEIRGGLRKGGTASCSLCGTTNSLTCVR